MRLTRKTNLDAKPLEKTRRQDPVVALERAKEVNEADVLVDPKGSPPVETQASEGSHLSSLSFSDPQITTFDSLTVSADAAALQQLIAEGKSLSSDALKGLYQSVMAGLKDGAHAERQRWANEAGGIEDDSEMFRGIGGLAFWVERMTDLGGLPLPIIAGVTFLGGMAAADVIALGKALNAAFQAYRADGDAGYAAGRAMPSALRVLNDLAMMANPAFIASSLLLTGLNRYLDTHDVAGATSSQ